MRPELLLRHHRRNGMGTVVVTPATTAPAGDRLPRQRSKRRNRVRRRGAALVAALSKTLYLAEPDFNWTHRRRCSAMAFHIPAKP